MLFWGARILDPREKRLCDKDLVVCVPVVYGQAATCAPAMNPRTRKSTHKSTYYLLQEAKPRSVQEPTGCVKKKRPGLDFEYTPTHSTAVSCFVRVTRAHPQLLLLITNVDVHSSLAPFQPPASSPLAKQPTLEERNGDSPCSALITDFNLLGGSTSNGVSASKRVRHQPPTRCQRKEVSSPDEVNPQRGCKPRHGFKLHQGSTPIRFQGFNHSGGVNQRGFEPRLLKPPGGSALDHFP